MEIAQERLGDARPTERGAIEAAALEPAFEEVGVRCIRVGEVAPDEVDGDVVTTRAEPLTVERCQVGQRDLAGDGGSAWRHVVVLRVSV